MIGFQVYTEYAWANDAIAKLPDQSIVVAKVEKALGFALGRMSNHRFFNLWY